MESWRPEPEGGGRHSAVSVQNLLLALAAHAAVFVLFFLYSVVHGLFRDDEKIIPIDLTIVVNENLDGKEDEPPPLDDPPPPPKPKPKPRKVVKKPDPPKALERMVTNIVAKVDRKEDKKEDQKPEKKKEEPKKEEPKKTAAELREERLAAMRNRAKNTNKKPVEIKVKNLPSGDGRTDKKTLSNAEIMNRLNAGYKPGKTTQLAQSEEQFALSLIKSAFEAKWNTPSRTPNMRPIVLKVRFGPGGRLLEYKLVSSSGDARADQSIRDAAQLVKAVPNLPESFIAAYQKSGIEIEFTVE